MGHASTGCAAQVAHLYPDSKTFAAHGTAFRARADPQTVRASRPSDIPEGPASVSAAALKNTHRLHGTRVNPP
jgi:hypothetical protein